MQKLVKKEYRIPFILVTSLFFLWGFAHAILDVLNKHFEYKSCTFGMGAGNVLFGIFCYGYSCRIVH